MPLYEFVCTSCGGIHDKVMDFVDKPEQIPCEFCEDGVADYQFGKPAMFRVKYEQNGRVAYKYDLGDGKKVHRSATREKYEHNLGSRGSRDLKDMGTDKNKSVYTKEYGRVVESKEKAKIDNLKKAIKDMKS